jgi:hypothetical protein
MEKLKEQRTIGFSPKYRIVGLHKTGKTKYGFLLFPSEAYAEKHLVWLKKTFPKQYKNYTFLILPEGEN